MNLSEGLSRIGKAIAVLIFLVAGLIAWKSDEPTQQNLDYATSSQLMKVLFELQTAEYREKNSQWDMEKVLYPGKAEPEIIKDVCATWPNAKVQEICKIHNRNVWQLAWLWVMHLLEVLSIAIVSAAVWMAVWAAFMWIVQGFTSPKRSA